MLLDSSALAPKDTDDRRKLQDRSARSEQAYIASRRSGPSTDTVYHIGYRGQPVITSWDDDEIRKMPLLSSYSYKDFINPKVSELAGPRMQHWSLRYWINFEDQFGDAVYGNVPDLVNDSSARIAHEELLRSRIIAENVLLPEMAQAIIFFHGIWTSSRETNTDDPAEDLEDPNDGRLYLDVRFPLWDDAISTLFTTPKLLCTEMTCMEWLGIEAGVGPTAPPQYALAELRAPSRHLSAATPTTKAAYGAYCRQTMTSFKSWTAKHKTQQKIVGWGGYFEDADATKNWDYTIFFVYKVPVAMEHKGSRDINDYKAQLRKCPPYTILDGRPHCNSLNFRTYCIECKEKPEYIHDIKGHLCNRCNTKGHAQNKCRMIKQPVKRKYYQNNEHINMVAVVDKNRNIDHANYLGSNARLQEFEKAAEARRAASRQL